MIKTDGAPTIAWADLPEALLSERELTERRAAGRHEAQFLKDSPTEAVAALSGAIQETELPPTVFVHDGPATLAALLQYVGDWHHAEVPADDPDWADWYADTMLGFTRLPEMLDMRPTRGQLSAALTLLDEAYRAVEGRDGAPWWDWYAVHLAERLQTADYTNATSCYECEIGPAGTAQARYDEREQRAASDDRERMLSEEVEVLAGASLWFNI